MRGDRSLPPATAAGLLDDAALVGYAAHLADKELQRYYRWNRQHRKGDFDVQIPAE